MKNSNQLLKTFLLAGVALLLSACGAHNQAENSNLSSELSPLTSAAIKDLSYCNQATRGDTSVKLKAYTDISNTVRSDYMYVRLEALPAKFAAGSSYISMYRWLANSYGTTHLDNVALKFMLVNSSSGKALTGWKTALLWSELKSAATAAGVTNTAAYLSSVNLVVDLRDTTGEYDVLKITNFDITTNKSIGDVDALLPLFHSNPADYAIEDGELTRASVLQGLHPFNAYINKGYTASQFAMMAKSLCF